MYIPILKLNEGKLTGNFLEQCRNVLIVKRQSATQQDVQDDATTPDINLRSSIKLAIDNFRGSIVGTATAGLEKAAVVHYIGQTEIGNLDIELFIKQKVLGLEISMGNLVSVTVLNGGDDLLKEATGIVLRHAPVLDDIVKKLAGSVLDDHNNFRGVGDHGISRKWLDLVLIIEGDRLRILTV